MIYVTSDWHGVSPDTIRALLAKAAFSPSDTLYVLGDVIDRGEYGVAHLLWLTEQPNVRFILGNHEDMLLACDWLLCPDPELAKQNLYGTARQAYARWKMNGAEPTILSLLQLTDEEKQRILAYLTAAPTYATVSVGGRDFVLVHGGLGGFEEGLPLDAYSVWDLVWTRPEPDTRYSEKFTTILGHTPTIRYGKQYAGRAMQTDTWIDIDAGVVAGYPPMLLRLDDMRAFYL